ncbi:hypothetical protein [Cytobacillus praedii]|uniref:Uncharacterized protein n=1 Tax=Cytobacillus praedii TaxID=1742358 RepID=A0A4R1ALC4_9BACI|nr:hypothetical protein [Cytobacillus praedii]TCI99991.1 hypothetical protein E0Y62_27075 [Cytobacillus praedii]
MKVYLVTNYEGLRAYKSGYTAFEAAGETAGKRSDFVYRIEVDIDEVQTEIKPKSVGHVYVQRKFIYKDGEVVQPN